MNPLPNEKKPEEGITKGARFLFDLFLSTVLAMADAVGPDNAKELMKPHMKFHNDAAVQMFKDKYKLKADDLYSLAVFQNYFLLFGGMILCNHQFFEHGYTADVHYCPYANCTQALCLSMDSSHEDIVKAINSDYEIFYTKMLVKGDPICQMMVKKKGHTIWGEVAKKAVEIPVPQLSYEELDFWQRAVFSQIWIYATNALVDFAGKEKAAEILHPYMRALGMSIAQELSKELGIKDRDAIAIASIIERCNEAANQKGTYSFHTPDKVEKEITECIFANASQDICADALIARSSGICEAINPEYKFIPLKRMCKGDKTCKWVIIKH